MSTKLKNSSITFFVFLFCVFAFINEGGAQDAATLQSTHMKFTGHELSPSAFNIKYDIPFNGVVEIRLFDDEGSKIWQHQFTNSYGENKITLKRSKFSPGDSYEYVLNYKTDEVRNTFVVPPTGFVE